MSSTRKVALIFLTVFLIYIVTPKHVANTVSQAIADPKVPTFQSTLINLLYSPDTALQMLDNEVSGGTEW
jgi:hypothetical protein